MRCDGAVDWRKKTDDLSISLVGISDGSDTATLAVSPRMYRAASKVAVAIASGDYSTIPQTGQGYIRAMWKKSKSADWTLRVKPNGNGIVEAAIKPSKEILRPGAISGRTTLFGVCERVGGANDQTMQFRLTSGDRHTINISGKHLAQEIGMSLHKTIGVEGVATWDIDSWKMSDFTADALVEYTKRNPVEAFEAIVEAAGDHWDDVAPDEYVSELRSD